MSEETNLPAVLIDDEAGRFMPALTMDSARERIKALNAFVKELMIEDKDFGTIPGTSKPTLYKPGAEKLTTFFGLRVIFIDERTVENWEADEPFFYYMRKCQLWRGDSLIAEASGSCNSKESRYRFRWVQEVDVPGSTAGLKTRGGKAGMFAWQFNGRETTGQYGRPESFYEAIDKLIEEGKTKSYSKVQHWNNKEAEFIEWDEVEYRVPNEDIFSQVNTILKMAEKRALVAATLIGCNASEFFTQDMEDIGFAVSTQIVDAVVTEVKEDKEKMTKADAKEILDTPTKREVDDRRKELGVDDEIIKGIKKDCNGHLGAMMDVLNTQYDPDYKPAK